MDLKKSDRKPYREVNKLKTIDKSTVKRSENATKSKTSQSAN